MPVEASPATAGPLVISARAVGTIRARHAARLAAETGGRITAIGFADGERVDAGAVLFSIDDAVLRAERDRARAELALARREHERVRSLHARGIASDSERDAAAARLELAQATLALAEARLAQATVRAPFAGIAGLAEVSVGDYVTAGTELVTLVDPSELEVDFRLAERSFPALREGLALQLRSDALPGESFGARVTAIDPQVDPRNRSVGVRARIEDGRGLLRPGMYARVDLVLETVPDAVRIPEQAVMPRGRRNFVYVIEDGKAQLREVMLGMRADGEVQVVSGVAAGELVITAGWQKIGPGAAVMPIHRDAD